MGKIAKALGKAAAAESKTSVSQVQGDNADATVANENKYFQGKSIECSEMGKPWDARLVMASAATGAVAESIRNLRTRILYPVIGETPRTLLVTSAAPGEGKSFICANLALSLAQGVDDYCLLADCDFRRPSQHKLFGLSNERGIVNHLQNGVAVEELITPSGVEKLSIFPAGPPPVNPAELSGSESMVRLVRELKSRYDDRFVVIDSPPHEAAAETAVLAKHVDGVVLVVRYGTSRRERVKALADMIGRDKIIGVVFNALETSFLDTKVFGYQDYKANYYSQQ